MSDVARELPGMSLVGVGAAFDMVSGRLPQAPPLFQRLGLEWLFRLAQEPRRLWRRYTTTNPAFLVAWLPEAIGHIRRRRRSR